MKPFAAAFAALLLCAAAPALAQGRPAMKPEDCAKAENAQRSDCARMLGKSGENARSNKGGETRAGERAGETKELNAAKDKPAKGGMHKTEKAAKQKAEKAAKEKTMEEARKQKGKKS